MNNITVGIIGNYGAENLGDELILHSLINEFTDCNIIVFSSAPHRTQNKYKDHKNVQTTHLFPSGIRSFARFHIFQSLKKLSQCKAVIFGGGSLFQDQQFTAIVIWSIQFLFCTFLRKPIYIYANGVGPIEKKISKWIVKKIFNAADTITLRDKDSQKLLCSLGVNEQKMYTFSDPVFAMEETIKKTNCTKKLFTISLRDSEGHTEKIFEILHEIIPYIFSKFRDSEIHFIGMQKNIDEKIINTILKKIDPKYQKKISTSYPQSHSEISKILQNSYIAIGMRLHFCILAALHNVPTISLSYSPKVKSIMAQINLENYCLVPKDWNPEAVIQKIQSIQVSPPKIQTKNLHSLAKENAQHFRKWLSEKS